MGAIAVEVSRKDTLDAVRATLMRRVTDALQLSLDKVEDYLEGIKSEQDIARSQWEAMANDDDEQNATA